MAVDRIYGQFQTAGVQITTAAKSQVNSEGTDAYAQVVGLLGSDGSTLVSSSNPFPVISPTAAPNLSVTRPNDTVAYGNLDVIGSSTNAGGAVLEFTNVGQSGDDVLIMEVDLRIDQTSIPAGMTTSFLALYSATPPSAYADNATWDLPAGDRSVWQGLVNIGTPTDLGSTLWSQNLSVNKVVTLAGTSLFAYLVTTTGFTPSASTVQNIMLKTAVLGK